jgi:hypothetical protein
VGYVSKHSSWLYIEVQSLAHTDRILNALFDIRIRLTFTPDECQRVVEIMACCANQILVKDPSL